MTALTMAATWLTVSSPDSGGSTESALGRKGRGNEEDVEGQ